MGTRGRTLLGPIVAAWIGAMTAVWLTHPRHGDGPYTQTTARHIYADAALFVLGLVAIPLVLWLVDRGQRGPRELRWRLILLVGVVLALAIGGIGIAVAVHPPYALRGTSTGGRDATLERYGLAGLAIVLVTGFATARTLPRPSTTTRASQAHPGR
jgi:hypothetical protein